MTDLATTRSKQAEGKQRPTEERDLTRLEPFVGKWRMEGQQHESPFGSAAKITAVETYEWLPGRCFLVHHLDGSVGGAEMACIEMIGNDPARPSSQGYQVHAFYNDGRSNEWQLAERGGAWTLTGRWEIAGASTHVRCTTSFDRGGNTRASKWERSVDGTRWQTFWEVMATRVQ